MRRNGSLSNRYHEEISSSSHSLRKSFNSSYTSRYEQSESLKLRQHSDAELQRLRTASHRLHKLRDKLYRSRLKLKELRNELRDERENINELEAKLMTALRQMRYVADFKIPTFETFYQELEERRDVFGSLQYDYDQAEEEHETIEAQLEQQEDVLQQILSRITAQVDDNDTDIPSVSTSPLSETFPSLQNTQNPSSWHEEELYQSRLGDARIVRERLQEISFEMEEIIRRRAAVAMVQTTDVSDTESMIEVKLAFSKTEAELKFIENDIEALARDKKPDIYDPQPADFYTTSSARSPGHAKSDIASAQSSPYLSKLHSKILQLRLQDRWIPPRHQDALRPGSTPLNQSLYDIRSSGEISWAHFLLRRSDELDITSYSDSGEAIRYQLMSIHPSPSSKALRAVCNYHLQFPTGDVPPKAQSEISWSEYDRRLCLEDDNCNV